MTWKHGRQTPDNNLMRFVAPRFRPSKTIWFLDIGSGYGANTTELRERGYSVDAIDRDVVTPADYHMDIRAFDFPRQYDCVVDVNCLCHVPDPPFSKIRDGLKPDGAFFSIWPTLDAPKRIEDGKSYTRRASEQDLRGMLKMFREVRIGTAHYQIPGGDYFRQLDNGGTAMKVKIDDDEVDNLVYKALKRSLKFLESDIVYWDDEYSDAALMDAMRLLIEYYGPPPE